MNFKTFPVATTTIFPISNSTTGGQLITEWNLRCRDMVSRYSEISYDVAATYVHNEADFTIRVQQDDSGTIISNSTLEVLPGEMIINGHYVKQEAHMYVDLLEANAELQAMGESPLKGKLAIGIKAFYSTESTMVGALEPENDEDVFVGVQLVVLPESKLITPKESPTNRNKVTCDIKLGTFTFLDNEIRSVKNFDGKIKYLDAERIDNIDEIISGSYVSREGINPKKLYVLAGKQINGITNDTWCDATDSLFVWDKAPTRTQDKPEHDVAQFIVNDDSETSLVLPHKGVDGMKVTLDEKNPDYGKDEYYEEVELPLPVADFSTNTSGTVTPAYTKRIKDINRKVDQHFHLVKGNQVAYMEMLNDLSELPPVNQNWDPGDYTLVNLDNYALAAEGDAEYTRPPATMYAVLPGPVSGVRYVGAAPKNSTEVPEGITGVQIGTTVEGDKLPVTTSAVESGSNQLVLGKLNNENVVGNTVTYTNSLGVVYKDDGNGSLVYSQDDNDDAEGNAKVTEVCLATYKAETDQLFTVEETTFTDTSGSAYTGYAFRCNGEYLTITSTYPYKLYFSSELSAYGVFNFIDSDNKSLLSSTDIAKMVTEDGNNTVRPVEIICKKLIISTVFDDTSGDTFLTTVSDLLSYLDQLSDEDTGVPKIKEYINDIKSALEEEDSDTALEKANDLNTSVKSLWGSSTTSTAKTAVSSAASALDAVQKASDADSQSVKDRQKAVQSAYDALDSFLDTINAIVESAKSSLEAINKAINHSTKTDNYNIYARLTAYNETTKVDDTDVTQNYVYMSANDDLQRQLWQVLERNDEVALLNSYYGKAVTQSDSQSLRDVTYGIDYSTGTISGITSIGSVSYQYTSNDVIAQLLNYFTVTDETLGVKDKDYFVYRYQIDENTFQDYYYVVSEEGKRTWSDPIWLTGIIQLATASTVGGFLNVDETDLDSGYVYVNDEGHLQLLDYGLLRSGTLAYQLGNNVTVTSGLEYDEIQDYLNERVNERVMFPNTSQISSVLTAVSNGATGVYADPNVIHLYIPLSASEDTNTVVIKNLDSRFGSSLYLHITGDANSNTTILLSNIERLRIDNALECDESDPPVIELNNCCLYYDASTLNMIRNCNENLDDTGIKGLSFWYERYEDTDAEIVVNDMTVREVNAPVVTDVIDFWNSTSPNDNHFHVALGSLTFADDSTIIGCSLLIANDSTSNVDEGHHISAGEFTLPQGSGLQYPDKCLTKPLKVTGTFESGYMSDDGYYVLQDTMFTALTQTYSTYDNASTVNGSILFHTDVNIIAADFGGISTEAWEPDTYHMFYGGSI